MKTYAELLEERKIKFVKYVESGKCFLPDGTTLKSLGQMATESLGAVVLARRCHQWLQAYFPELARARSTSGLFKAKRAKDEANALAVLVLIEVEDAQEAERIAQAHPITFGDLQVALAKVKGASTVDLPSMRIPLIAEPQEPVPPSNPE